MTGAIDTDTRERLAAAPVVTRGQPLPTPRVSTVDRLRDRMPTDWNIAWLVALGITLLAFVLRIVQLTLPEYMTFDETYYAKDAFALLQSGYEHDWTEESDEAAIAGDFSGMQETGSFIAHPPLGKWLIAAGIQLFGFNAFGFRLPSVIFGSLLILVVTMLTRRLARSTMIGAIAGILLTFDGLHFVMSRIALLDIFQAFFVVAAIAAVVVDRDWFRNKLADHMVANRLPDLQGAAGPLLLWRPWRLVAGVLFGLACAVKWNSVYALAAFAVLSVVWDLGARHLAGADRSALKSLITDAPAAFFYLVVVAIPVYIASWWGWLTTSGGYYRDYGQTNPDDPAVMALGNAFGSLWIYHREIYGFHTGDDMKEATHAYDAHPASWLIMGRTTAIDAVNDIPPGTEGCPGPDECLRVINAMGTPFLWWIGVLALAAALVFWIINRDWRFGVPVVGMASMWLTWFPNSERPVFFFYAITIIPFTCIAVALCLGKIIGPTDGKRRRVGAIVAGVIVALVVINFAYIYPVLTDTLLSHGDWYSRMWFQSWI